jgi:hypothetical protein
MATTNTRGRVARAAATMGLAAALGCAGLGLAGCAASYEQDVERVTAGVVEQLGALQDVDAATAASLMASDFTTQLADAGVDVGAFYQAVLNGMTYELGTAEAAEDGSQIAVPLTVTAKDGNAAMQLYAATLTNELATAAGRDALAALSDDELTAYAANEMQAAFQDASVPLVSVDVTLVYQKDGTAWTLQNPEELASALLGGLTFAQAAAVTDEQVAAAADQASANVEALAASQAPAQDEAADGADAPGEGEDAWAGDEAGVEQASA